MQTGYPYPRRADYSYTRNDVILRSAHLLRNSEQMLMDIEIEARRVIQEIDAIRAAEVATSAEYAAASALSLMQTMQRPTKSTTPMAGMSSPTSNRKTRARGFTRP
jgi:hypothetical protein